MRLHNFFIEQKIGDSKNIIVQDANLLHQLRSVFRLKSGEEVVLLDNSGYKYIARIENLSKDEGSFEILNNLEIKQDDGPEISLYVSMIKKDNFEWVLEKGTEIGVKKFVPILSERSVKTNFNFERGAKIIKEATEQSGRGILPELNPIISLGEAIKEVKNNGVQTVSFDIGESYVNAKQFISENLNGKNNVALFIGPEGGWTENEIEMFKENDIEVVSLGEATLRAETAAIIASSLFLF